MTALVNASISSVTAALVAAGAFVIPSTEQSALICALEQLLGTDMNVAVGVDNSNVIVHFPVPTGRTGAMQDLSNKLAAVGWAWEIRTMEEVNYLFVTMPRMLQQAAPAAAPAAPVEVAAAAAPAPVTAPAAAPQAAPAPVAAPVVAAAPAAASANPADMMAAMMAQMMATMESATAGATAAVARAEAERNALLAAVTAATAAQQAAQATLSELKVATTAAQTAAQAAVAALAARAAAPAPVAKTEWMSSTPVKVTAGVVAAGLVAGAGYYAYNRFFGAASAAE